MTEQTQTAINYMTYLMKKFESTIDPLYKAHIEHLVRIAKGEVAP